MIHSRLNDVESDEWRSVERKSKSKDLVVLMKEGKETRGRKKLFCSFSRKGRKCTEAGFKLRRKWWVEWTLFSFYFSLESFTLRKWWDDDGQRPFVSEDWGPSSLLTLLPSSLSFFTKYKLEKRDDDWVNEWTLLPRRFSPFSTSESFSPLSISETRMKNDGENDEETEQDVVVWEEQLKNWSNTLLSSLSLSQKLSTASPAEGLSLSLSLSILTHPTHVSCLSLSFPHGTHSIHKRAISLRSAGNWERKRGRERRIGSERRRKRGRNRMDSARKKQNGQWEEERRKTGWGGTGLLASQKLKARRISTSAPHNTCLFFSLSFYIPLSFYSTFSY